MKTNALQKKILRAAPARVPPLSHAAAERRAARQMKSSAIQTKLAAGAPNDVYEQEVDRIADQVLAAPANRSFSAAPPRIQRYAGQATKEANTAPSSVDRVLASHGSPLDQALQQDMGQRFGLDFSRVRVHTGAAAEQSAQEVDAYAYTVGSNIVFGAGRFAPGTSEGQRLIAHELTHVVQQTGSDGNCVGRNETSGLSNIGSPVTEHEKITSGSIKTASVQREEANKPGPTKPGYKIIYNEAEKANKNWAVKLGWGTDLETVAGGRFASWKTLWDTGEYQGFADAVASYQAAIGFTGNAVDGVLGPNSWYRIAGMGQAMASITKIERTESFALCYEASWERMQTGYRRATGSKFKLPEGATGSVFEWILGSHVDHMLDVPVEYRGKGAAGALVYAGLGRFVDEADIWTGKLLPGATLQVWAHEEAYELLRAGEVPDESRKDGGMRRLTEHDANFYGTSAVFVRYKNDKFEAMEVRHFDTTEIWQKGKWPVVIAANPNESAASPEPGIPVMQRKRSIGASNDPLEQEADRVAEQVMAAPPNRSVSSAHREFSALQDNRPLVLAATEHCDAMGTD